MTGEIIPFDVFFRQKASETVADKLKKASSLEDELTRTEAHYFVCAISDPTMDQYRFAENLRIKTTQTSEDLFSVHPFVSPPFIDSESS